MFNSGPEFIIPLPYHKINGVCDQDSFTQPCTATETTVISEIFARILFTLIALKNIFATLEIRELGMIYVYQ